MRLLDNVLPSEYETAEGRVLSFETDFRVWMQLENLMLDKDIPDSAKPAIAKNMIFRTPLKGDQSTFLLWFCPSKQEELYKSLKNRVLRIPDFFIKN